MVQHVIAELESFYETVQYIGASFTALTSDGVLEQWLILRSFLSIVYLWQRSKFISRYTHSVGAPVYQPLWIKRNMILSS